MDQNIIIALLEKRTRQRTEKNSEHPKKKHKISYNRKQYITQLDKKKEIKLPRVRSNAELGDRRPPILRLFTQQFFGPAVGEHRHWTSDHFTTIHNDTIIIITYRIRVTDTGLSRARRLLLQLLLHGSL